MEKTKAHPEMLEVRSMAQELLFRAALAEDEVAAFGSTKGTARLVGGMCGLNYLGREGKVRTGEDPNFYWSIIAWLESS